MKYNFDTVINRYNTNSLKYCLSVGNITKGTGADGRSVCLITGCENGQNQSILREWLEEIVKGFGYPKPLFFGNLCNC